MSELRHDEPLFCINNLQELCAQWAARIDEEHDKWGEATLNYRGDDLFDSFRGLDNYRLSSTIRLIERLKAVYVLEWLGRWDDLLDIDHVLTEFGKLSAAYNPPLRP